MPENPGHGSVDLNQASRDELAQVEGIGPERADQIIQYREQQGSFKNVDELDSVPGFADQLVDVAKDQLTVK